MKPLSSRSIADFRLRRHHLKHATAPDAVSICRDVCGLQAQVMSAAYLQLWARNAGVTRSDMDKALWNTRRLVKTSLMRQTLHVIPSDEFAIYIAALRASRVAGALRVMARFGITPEEADASTAAILDALSSGALPRPAITAAVRPKASRRVRAWMEKVWSILRIPVAQGLVCYGPGEGNEVKFIRVDQWLPRLKAITETEARCVLLRKYLRAYGPASIHDFAHWSGISVKDCRAAFEHLKDELVMIEGEAIHTEDRDAFKHPKRDPTTVNLLPIFDPYLLAHSKKHHLVEDRYYKLVYRNQGWISAVILLEGKAAGTWSYKPAGSRLMVELDPFEKLPGTIQSRVEAQAATLAASLGRELALRWLV
jgi:hypothetical protein